MARPKPKVNQVVTYVGTGRKLRPAFITAVAGTGPYTVSLKVKGGSTPTGVSERTYAGAHATNVWYRYA